VTEFSGKGQLRSRARGFLYLYWEFSQQSPASKNPLMPKAVRGVSIKVAMATVIRSAGTRHWINAWPTDLGKAGRVHPVRTRHRRKIQQDARATTPSEDNVLLKKFRQFHDVRRHSPRLIATGNKPWALAFYEKSRRGEEVIMRLSLLTLGVFAAIVCFEKPAEAQDGRWCAYYNFHHGGATNCGFATFQQCLATVTGIGGDCGPNPMYQSAPERYPPTRYPRRYPY
jgi:hypothetical protein